MWTTANRQKLDLRSGGPGTRPTMDAAELWVVAGDLLGTRADGWAP